MNLGGVVHASQLSLTKLLVRSRTLDLLQPRVPVVMPKVVPRSIHLLWNGLVVGWLLVDKFLLIRLGMLNSLFG